MSIDRATLESLNTVKRSTLQALRLMLACATLLVPLFASSKILDGEISYARPATSPEAARALNEAVLPRSFDDSWSAMVDYVSQHGMVIDRLDKESGLVIITFSLSNPRDALDCGSVSSWVKNLRGRRDYHFDGASPIEHYERVENGTLIGTWRKLTVDGKLNIFLSRRSANETGIRVTARYVAVKSAKLDAIGVPEHPTDETAAFNTGEIGRFLPSGSECVPHGRFEGALINAITAKLEVKPSPPSNAGSEPTPGSTRDAAH